MNIQTTTARSKLKARRAGYFETLAPGVSLGVRINGNGIHTWLLRIADGAGGAPIKSIGTVGEPGDPAALDYWRARERALKLGRGEPEDSASGPLTVRQAFKNYEADLIARGAGPGNARHVLYHMPDSLQNRVVATLTATDLKNWVALLRNAGMKSATLKRHLKSAKAGFNLAAKDNPEAITNDYAWNRAFANLDDEYSAVKNLLEPEQIQALIDAAYALDYNFGLYVQTLAVTGVRRSQLLALTVGDLVYDSKTPALNMPSSKKGRNRKVDHGPSSIPVALAQKLRSNRADHAPLFVQANGEAWTPNMLAHRFKVIAAQVGVPDVRSYALRHSYITTTLQKGVPTAMVGAAADTSERMMKKTYAKYIRDNADPIMRAALVDYDAPPATGKVVKLRN